MRTIIETIESADYVVDETQVEALAHAVATGVKSVATYLRVLLVACVSQLGTNKRRSASANQLAVIDKQHERFYAAVLRGVSNGDETTPAERNRRATFARSAAATLRLYVRSGGDLRTLDASTVTKGGLRAAIAPAEPGNPLERSFGRSQAALLRAVRRMAKKDPDEARQHLEAALDALEQELDALPEVHQGETTIVGANLSRTPVRDRPGAQLHQAV